MNLCNATDFYICWRLGRQLTHIMIKIHGDLKPISRRICISLARNRRLYFYLLLRQERSRVFINKSETYNFDNIASFLASVCFLPFFLELHARTYACTIARFASRAAISFFAPSRHNPRFQLIPRDYLTRICVL